MKRQGDPPGSLRKPGPRPTPPAILFWTKVNRPSPSECWTWLGATDRYGFGIFGTWDPLERKTTARRAWIVAWELLFGSRPEARAPTWTCGDHACVNWAHLRFRARRRRVRSPALPA